MLVDKNLHQTTQQTTHIDTPKSLDLKQTVTSTVTNVDTHEKTILKVDKFFAVLRSYLGSQNLQMYVVFF